MVSRLLFASAVADTLESHNSEYFYGVKTGCSYLSKNFRNEVYLSYFDFEIRLSAVMT